MMPADEVAARLRDVVDRVYRPNNSFARDDYAKRFIDLLTRVSPAEYAELYTALFGNEETPRDPHRFL